MDVRLVCLVPMPSVRLFLFLRATCVLRGAGLVHQWFLLSWGATCALALSALAISGLPFTSYSTFQFYGPFSNARRGSTPPPGCLGGWKFHPPSRQPGEEPRREVVGGGFMPAFPRQSQSHREGSLGGSHTSQLEYSTVRYPYCKGLGWRVYRI